ncbi:DUF3099 domain-containing protein [Paenarthrobacter sp. YAF11_1]|uniref:DUF3099 domain-containing protein n=1 Tax=Micrococcaceae TaxID=1268 RepID=UPI002883223C|nr:MULTISPECIES: DUF3099 domain-containing protein [unclassified Arthrobacter]
MERDDSVVTRENSPLQQVPGEPDAFSGDPEVHSITDAAAAHSEDMRERMIKYAVAMGIRMVCIVLIFVVDGWFKIIAIAGAVFLPWIAVVIANGNDKAEDHSESLLDYVAVPEIERSSQPEEAPADGPTVLQGELVDDEPTSNPGGPTTGPASEAGYPGDERAAS